MSIKGKRYIKEVSNSGGIQPASIIEEAVIDLDASENVTLNENNKVTTWTDKKSEVVFTPAASNADESGQPINNLPTVKLNLVMQAPPGLVASINNPTIVQSGYSIIFVSRLNNGILGESSILGAVKAELTASGTAGTALSSFIKDGSYQFGISYQSAPSLTTIQVNPDGLSDEAHIFIATVTPSLLTAVMDSSKNSAVPTSSFSENVIVSLRIYSISSSAVTIITEPNAEVARFLVFNKVLSAKEITQVTKELAKIYGIAN